MSGPKPPSNAKMIGTVVIATSGDKRLVMIKAMKVTIMPYPRNDSICITLT
ncbi:hypothetical protein D3C79_933900 [compost metagenome]